MRDPRPSYRATLAVLASVFAIELVALGIAPVSRTTWILENLLVLALVVALAATYRTFRFSRLSYALIFVFLAVHEIGAHYTYSLVPYDAFFRRALGFSIDETLGLERNHFDRAIHLLYGLLFVHPMREVFLRVVGVRGFWGYALPLSTTMSTSMLYELIEWGAATVFGGEVGMEYLGTQGDVWDAHKDMALASLGAFVSMGLAFGIDRALGRDPAAERADGLRVAHGAPRGEEGDAGRSGARRDAAAVAEAQRK